MPGQGEDLLDNHRPAEQVSDLNADRGEHRDERILEGVPVQHAPLAQPLATGGADVVLAEYLEQARAEHPRQVGRQGQPEGD